MSAAVEEFDEDREYVSRADNKKGLHLWPVKGRRMYYAARLDDRLVGYVTWSQRTGLWSVFGPLSVAGKTFETREEAREYLIAKHGGGSASS